MSNSQLRGLRRISFVVTGLALMGGALLGGVKPAHATPSGLSNYPSTDIYPKGNIHFDADYFSSTGGKTGNFATEGFEYGVGPEKDSILGRSEIGFDYIESAGGLSHGKRILLNGKTQLFNNAASGIRATFGFYGVGNKDAGAANWLNLLASKAFSFGRITVGGAYALRKSALETPVGHNPRSVFQLGYDKAIKDKFIVCADYQSGKGQFISPGVIYLLNEKAGLELSYLRGGKGISDVGSPRNQIYFGFDYNFGKVYAPPTSPTAPAGEAGAGGGGGGGGGGG